MRFSWTKFKSLIDGKNLVLSYTEGEGALNTEYWIWTTEGNVLFECSINDTEDASDVTDFETNYKSSANVAAPAPIVTFGNVKQTIDKAYKSEKGANVNNITSTSTFTTIVSKTVGSGKTNAYVEFFFSATEDGTVKLQVEGTTFLRIYYKARDTIMLRKLVPEKVDGDETIEITYKPNTTGADAFANIAGFNL